MPTPPTMLSKPGRCNINSYNDWTTTQGSPSYQTGWLRWWVYVSRLLRSLDYDKSKVLVDKVVVMFQSGWTAHIDTLLIHLLYVPNVMFIEISTSLTSTSSNGHSSEPDLTKHPLRKLKSLFNMGVPAATPQCILDLNAVELALISPASVCTSMFLWKLIISLQ